MTRTLGRAAIALPLFAALASCGGGGASRAGGTTRLVDVFTPAMVSGTKERAAPPSEPIEWRFDREGAAAAFDAGLGVADLGVRGGVLAGRSTTDVPLVRATRATGLDENDLLHEVRVRARMSAGSNMGVAFRGEETVDFEQVAQAARDFLLSVSGPIQAGGEFRTYALPSPFPISHKDTRHVILRPTDAADATFEIESVRLVFRKERLASITSGVSWQGLSEIYRETVVARAPETVSFSSSLPARPRLDVAIGTTEDTPVTFRIGVERRGRSPENVLERTVTTADRWEESTIDLAAFGGEPVSLRFSLLSEKEGAIGFWGSVALRDRGARPASALAKPPRGIIVFLCDTLRRDHLDLYGYSRETAPAIRRLADEGALFLDCVAQATWTKVSSPSLFTSLYPLSHGVRAFADRLPASAQTLTETLRTAGYATVSYSSVMFTGKFTNLHKGFESLHESTSLRTKKHSKTAREFVDRFLPFLDAHQDVPFFAFLHVFDPHDPYEPHPPYDALWADPAKKTEHEKHLEEARKVIADPLMKRFGMPTRAELEAAGIDADEYVDHDRAWYDGSIRAMDVEIARVLERLRELSLDKETLLVFTSDHGEEFLEHGRMFHGQTVYGELTRVPLVVHWPGAVKAGTRVEPTVESVDLMPTILELAGIAAPRGLQGKSLVPLLEGRAAAWDRPAFSEKAKTSDGFSPPPRGTESYAVVHGGWKLVHHVERDGATPEFELFDAKSDPLDSRNLAGDRPAEVARLRALLDSWRERSAAARLPADDAAAESMTADELERLRALGYIK